jgi:cysteine desulfurase
VTIYLDYAATTPVDPRVAAAMAECLRNPAWQANPASATHGPGLVARDLVEEARGRVAALVRAEPREIIFTSGATEANNLAILGVVAAARRAKRSGHLVSSRVEHKSVLDALQQAGREGFAVTLLEPDETGRVPPDAVRTALRDDTLLVSLMLANNEIGVLNDIAAIGAITSARGVLLHTDASQAVGKIPVDLGAAAVDLLSFTAHKFYGPKGIGALFVREAARPRVAPIQFGGGHERGLRSGTLPTHQLVGFGVAATLAQEALAHDAAHARDLAERLWRELESVPGVEFNSPRREGVPGLVNASFPGVEGESLVSGLTEIAVSTGSACSSATREASYVLRALGRDTELAQSSLRVSLGRFTTAPEVDMAATAIRAEVFRLRRLAGIAPPDHSPRETAPRAAAGSPPDREFNDATRRYFLAPARPLEFEPGNVPPGVVQGHAGRQADGAEVRFELKIVDGTVKSAHFSAYGCPHTLAVTAWLCEVLEGARIDGGVPGNPAQWAQRFDVPAEKLGRLLTVEDALRAAFRASTTG